MVGFILSTLVLTSVTLVLMGFAANLGMFRGRLDQPGAYWTFSMLVLLPIHLMLHTPTWAMVVNGVGVCVMIAAWVSDIKDGVKG